MRRPLFEGLEYIKEMRKRSNLINFVAKHFGQNNGGSLEHILALLTLRVYHTIFDLVDCLLSVLPLLAVEARDLQDFEDF